MSDDDVGIQKIMNNKMTVEQKCHHFDEEDADDYDLGTDNDDDDERLVQPVKTKGLFKKKRSVYVDDDFSVDNDDDDDSDDDDDDDDDNDDNDKSSNDNKAEQDDDDDDNESNFEMSEDAGGSDFEMSEDAGDRNFETITYNNKEKTKKKKDGSNKEDDDNDVEDVDANENINENNQSDDDFSDNEDDENNNNKDNEEEEDGNDIVGLIKKAKNNFFMKPSATEDLTLGSSIANHYNDGENCGLFIDNNGKRTRTGIQYCLDSLFTEFYPDNKPSNGFDYLKWCYERFSPKYVGKKKKYVLEVEYGEEIYSVNRIRAAYELRLNYVLMVYHDMIRYNMCGDYNTITIENQRKIAKILELLTFCYKMIETQHIGASILHESGHVDVPTRIRTYHFCFFSDIEQSPFEQLVSHLLSRLLINGYRKKEDSCFEQIMSPKGYPTHAWKKKMSIQDFILIETNKDTQGMQYRNLMSARDNLRHLVKHLIECKDPEFPELSPDRHIFSFKNGIYHAMLDKFFSYEDQKHAKCHILNSVVSVKYFPYDFENTRIISENIMQSINTPTLDTILNTQDIPKSAQEYMYALIGRCVFEVGELDNWQIILFVKGLAGTGKSTIGKLILNFYPPENVAVIGSTFEEKFGLAAIHDKFVCVCYEMSNKVGLTQTDLQSIGSGEEMSIAVKNKVAVTKKWTAGMVLFGNKIGKWIDTAGSLQRRIVVFEFMKKITASDPLLHVKLRKEMPNIIRKSVKCYLKLAKSYGTQDFERFAPDYFKQTATNFQKQINPLRCYLDSDVIILDENAYISYEDFKKSFANYCKDNNINQSNLFSGDGLSPEELNFKDIYCVDFTEFNPCLRWGDVNCKGRILLGLTVAVNGTRFDTDSGTSSTRDYIERRKKLAKAEQDAKEEKELMEKMQFLRETQKETRRLRENKNKNNNQKQKSNQRFVQQPQQQKKNKHGSENNNNDNDNNNDDDDNSNNNIITNNSNNNNNNNNNDNVDNMFNNLNIFNGNSKGSFNDDDNDVII